MGGATLEKHPDPDPTLASEAGAVGDGEEKRKATSPPPMTGSMFIATAETEDEIWEMLNGDVYAKSGVWNLSQAKVWPFRVAVESFSNSS